jgi:ankyrin repeat protein
VNAKVKFGWNPLHIASANGHKAVAELLISSGADLNAKDNNDGWIPLHYAAQKGHKEIAELLIANGVDVNAKKAGQTPLDVAILRNDGKIADLLRKHGGKTGEELKASSKGDSAKKSKLPIPKWTITSVIGVAIAVLMLAIFNGSKLKAPNISIHQAVFNGNIEAIKQHLAAGTDVNARNVVSGETPLHLAAVYGHKEIVELLIAASADANAKMRNGRTALDKAKQHPEIANLLRKHGGKTSEELKAEGK